MMNDDYKPVSCAMHSEYELAIMHKQRLVITWKNDLGETRTEEVMPTDIIIRNSAEYLLVLDQYSNNKEIRLDKITLNHLEGG